MGHKKMEVVMIILTLMSFIIFSAGPIDAYAATDGLTAIQYKGPRGGGGGGGGTVGQLTQVEIDAILYMWEEEKMARDVYSVLGSKWNRLIFDNISSSEQMHMNAVKTLCDGYGLLTPSSGVPGIFVNPILKSLFDQLIAQGSISLLDAIRAGLAVEEIDILDLRARIALTDNADIKNVFNKIMQGSYHHLNAFASNYYNISGTAYVPQYLDQADYDAIVSLTGGSGSGGGCRCRR